ncbi:MAG TPA: TIGR02206 family membrane protein [Solirubrobacteraceae bacterium]|nr:TIGR02206 family membrane protein [Solirubrobacteraceae bacterium]
MDLLARDHVGALLAIAALAAAAGWLPRARPGAWVVAASRALAVVIAAAYVTDHAVAASRGIWSLRVYLPLHLSDAATLVAVLALWSPRPLPVELTYLWGLSASLQAALTPDLPHVFPDVLFLTYFVTHGGVIVAALLLVCGRRLAPRPGAIARAFAATAGVAVLAAAGCLATGGNYMFLRRKPDDSLLDLLGPWPWYIAFAGLLALAMFALLLTPFRERARDTS